MNTKLTLSIDQSVIRKAKHYARMHNQSLSHIIQEYLEFITEDQAYQAEIDPGVLAIADEIAPEMLESIEDSRFRYLKEKYLDA